MSTTDLFSIDRKIVLAARALDGWRGELPVSDRNDDDDAIGAWKELATRNAIESAAKSTLAPIATTPALLLSTGTVDGPTLTSVEDPLAALRPAVTSWCAHLLIARSIRDATAARAALLRDERDCDANGRPASLRAMLRALARPRQAGGVPEGRAAACIEDLSPQTLDGIVDEETRRRELAEGIAQAKCCYDIDEAVVAEADAFLASTADQAKDLFSWGLRACSRATKSPTWVDAFFVRRAADVSEGWPSSLSARWIAELARGTELVSGLSLDVRVDAGRLAPHADHACLRLAPPTGAWTFSRALYALGAALRMHGRDKNAPFSSHTVPHDTRPWILAEAFQALASTPVFHARARGVASAKAESSARRLTTTRLLERRHLAFRVKLSAELSKSRRVFLDAFSEGVEDALLGSAPREAAAFLGAPGPTGFADDAARFRAIAPGEKLARELVERFDADWWRNPKAASWIRDRCAR